MPQWGLATLPRPAEVPGLARVWSRGPASWPRLQPAQAHLPLVVLAMDLHEVLLHLHRQVLGREVLHVQEDDKLVPVRSDLKPSTRVGPEGLRLRDGDWLEQPELGGRGSVPGYRNRKNHQGSDRSLRVPGDRGTWDLGASGHSANNQNLRGQLSA